MAYVVMAYMVISNDRWMPRCMLNSCDTDMYGRMCLAYIVMAYIHSYDLYTYGPYSYGLCSYGVYGYIQRSMDATMHAK